MTPFSTLPCYSAPRNLLSSTLNVSPLAESNHSQQAILHPRSQQLPNFLLDQTVRLDLHGSTSTREKFARSSPVALSLYKCYINDVTLFGRHQPVGSRPRGVSSRSLDRTRTADADHAFVRTFDRPLNRVSNAAKVDTIDRSMAQLARAPKKPYPPTSRRTTTETLSVCFRP